MSKYNIITNKSEDGSCLPCGTIVHPRYGSGTWWLEFTEQPLGHTVDRKIKLEYDALYGSGSFMVFPDIFPKTETELIDLVEYMVDEELRIRDIEDSECE